MNPPKWFDRVLRRDTGEQRDKIVLIEQYRLRTQAVRVRAIPSELPNVNVRPLRLGEKRVCIPTTPADLALLTSCHYDDEGRYDRTHIKDEIEDISESES